MGLELLATHGLILVQAGLTVDERVGFLLGIEFAGTKLTADALETRVRYYRNEIHSAISQKLKEQAQRANATDTAKTTKLPKTTKTKPTRSMILHEIDELRARCNTLQGQIGIDEHAVENLILAGNRMATLTRQLEKV